MRVHLDIEDGISPETALECVKQVVEMGRISKNDTMYCYATTFYTSQGQIEVYANDYRKSDCFKIIKHKHNQLNKKNNETNRRTDN